MNTTGSQQTPNAPHIQFSTFILGLAHAGLTHMGVVPDSMAGERKIDLELARQHIEILAILETKTKGNLSKEESELLSNILTDLRMRYLHSQNTNSKETK